MGNSLWGSGKDPIHELRNSPSLVGMQPGTKIPKGVGALPDEHERTRMLRAARELVERAKRVLTSTDQVFARDPGVCEGPARSLRLKG